MSFHDPIGEPSGILVLVHPKKCRTEPPQTFPSLNLACDVSMNEMIIESGIGVVNSYTT